MNERPPEISILDQRLAEIDRRLSSIQSGLMVAEGEARPGRPQDSEAGLPPRVPVHAAPPPPPPPSSPRPAAPAPPPFVDDVRRLLEAQEQVLAATRALLDRLSAGAAPLNESAPAPGRAAAPPGPAGPPPREPPEREPGAPPVQQFRVSAGPFASTEAVRAFERTLERIPEVREVEVRGYEGSDRAIVDVHLFEPKS